MEMYSDKRERIEENRAKEEKVEGMMQRIIKLEGRKWRIITVYIRGEMEEKLKRLTERIREAKS